MSIMKTVITIVKILLLGAIIYWSLFMLVDQNPETNWPLKLLGFFSLIYFAWKIIFKTLGQIAHRTS